MNTLVDYFNQTLSMIPANVLAIIQAILLLILAFIVAAIVKKLVVKLINKTKLKEKLAKYEVSAEALDPKDRVDGEIVNPAVEYIGKLVYLIAFLLFVPGIFTVLGINNISEPIITFLNSIWGFLPNILAAVIVLVVGNLVAKLVRQVLIPVFDKIKVNKIQEKAGIEVKDTDRLSVTLAYIVYVLILIPVIIVALNVLKIDAVSTPAVNMLNVIFTYVPNILVAIVLIWIGVIIGKFSGQLVKLLIGSTGVDAKIRNIIGEKGEKFEFSKVVGLIVQIVIDIFFIVQGCSALKLDIMSNIGNNIIAYMPNVLAAVLILIVAFLAGQAAEGALKKTGLGKYAIIARVAIIVVAVFMVFNQLSIASTIVNYAFLIILGALAVAFAVAFGVGGRGFADHMLKKVSDKIDEQEPVESKQAE